MLPPVDKCNIDMWGITLRQDLILSAGILDYVSLPTPLTFVPLNAGSTCLYHTCSVCTTKSSIPDEYCRYFVCHSLSLLVIASPCFGLREVAGQGHQDGFQRGLKLGFSSSNPAPLPPHQRPLIHSIFS